MSLSFITDSVIPEEAFTVFGVSAKPNSDNPIGFFGTGLKYAIAVLVRHKITVKLFRNGVEYEFYVKEAFFRDQGYDSVRVRKRKNALNRWLYKALPFTTELGKQWELWQAYRELATNTMDENGQIILQDNSVPPVKTGTEIRIEDSKLIENIHSTPGVVFLPSDLQDRGLKLFGTDTVDVYAAPSKFVYYRNMRVMELEDKALFTYNFKSSMFLTEDRTLKYPFLAKSMLVEAWAGIDNKEHLKKLISLKEDSCWEASFDWTEVRPTLASQAFYNSLRDVGPKNLHHSALAFAERYNYGTPTTPTARFRKSVKHGGLLVIHDHVKNLVVCETNSVYADRLVDLLNAHYAVTEHSNDGPIPF